MERVLLYLRNTTKKLANAGDMRIFSNIEELIRMLGREKALLRHMFVNRKELTVRYDAARELVEYKEDRIRFLIEHGVIHDSGDFLELEDVYLNFFESVLEVNEEISVAGVRESIEALDSAIRYYQMENSEQRRYEYLKQVRRILRNIALSTFRNVIDLKRNIDSTYKNEPNYAIKKEKLRKLDEKRLGISELIRQTERFIDEKQQGFFTIAQDVTLRATVSDVKLQLTEAYHNLIELDRQIIDYLNLIEFQNRLLKKLRRIKYLKDQMVLESQSNIGLLVNRINPVWMENRPKYTIKLSLDMLRNTDEGLQALKSLSLRLRSGRVASKRKAEPLSKAELSIKPKVLDAVSTLELKNAFLASGTHLFEFIRNYNYHRPLQREEKLVLFCQIVSQFLPELRVTGRMGTDQDIEYPFIFPA